MGVPGKLCFFRDVSLKIGTVRENPVRVVGHLTCDRRHPRTGRGAVPAQEPGLDRDILRSCCSRIETDVATRGVI